MSENRDLQVRGSTAGLNAEDARRGDGNLRGCPPLSGWQDLLNDLTPAGERELLEQHLEECPHCLDAVAVLAAGESIASETEAVARGGGTRGSVEPLPQSSRALLTELAQPQTFRRELAEVSRAQPLPKIDGLQHWVEVGRGGVGVVYRAWQEATNRLVAVKLLSLGPTRQGSARILREAELLGRLRHPHVVTIYGTGVSGGAPYLLMEWLSGGTLQQRIEAGEIPIGRAVHWTRQLAEAVAAAHALGIVHRDLKPANVLLEPSAEGGRTDIVKLTDFGLAYDQASDQRLTLTGQVLGTPHYMAPEQTGLLPQLGEPGPAADVYGLGAILFALLSGRPPHGGNSTSQTLLQVSQREPQSVCELRPVVPRDLATIVGKCLRQDPAQRYASARELADDLRRFAEGQPILARPYALTERVGKWIWRRPMATVALLLLAALAGSWVWSNAKLERAGNDLSEKSIRLELAHARLGRTLTEQAQALAKLDSTNDQLLKAQEELSESEEKVGQAQRVLQKVRDQLSITEEGLRQTEERWQQQTQALHQQIFQMIDLLNQPNIPHDEGKWENLREFRRTCEREIELGMYRKDRQLTLGVGRLLCDLNHLWQERANRERDDERRSEFYREAGLFNDLVEKLTEGAGSEPELVHLQLDARMRRLRLTRFGHWQDPPGPEQVSQARELAELLRPVESSVVWPVSPVLSANCLIMIDWGISREAARDLAGQLTAEAARLATTNDEPQIRELWLRRLGMQVLLEEDLGHPRAERIIQQLTQVSRESRERFPDDASRWVFLSMEPLQHWTHEMLLRRDESGVRESLPRWREGFDDLAKLNEPVLIGQLPVAGVFVPLEARLLEQRGAGQRAGELLSWFQQLTDTQAPGEAVFEWQQAQARARIARARQELARGERHRADQWLEEAVQRLSRWLSHPQYGRMAYEDWFHARLTIAEHREPTVPFEVQHRELLDLEAHCPPGSRLRYHRAVFEVALRAGEVASARKALNQIPFDHNKQRQVGEEFDTASVRWCLESLLPEDQQVWRWPKDPAP